MLMGTPKYRPLTTADVDALRKHAGDRWRAPECLLTRALEYWNARANGIVEMFNRAAGFWKLSPDKLGVLMEDYKRALFGVFDFTATREQMAELSALQSTNAFILDPYGLYYTVLGAYRDLTHRFGQYDRITAPPEQYNGPASQGDALRVYLNSPDLWDGRAIAYLLRWGQFNAALFAQEMGPAEVNHYLGIAREWADAADYFDYCVVAKYCLSAAEGEIEQIRRPAKFFGHVDYTTIENLIWQAHTAAERAINRVQSSLLDLTQTDTNDAAATVEAVETLQEQATPPKRDLVRVPQTYAAILSRDVYISLRGENPANENEILPIQSKIRDYLEKHPDTSGTTTPRIIEKTIEGINLLQQARNVAPVNGLYTLKTTLSEFAEFCGYTDAGEDQKRALLLSLNILNGIYLAVWRPRGLYAVNLLNVREIGVKGQAKGEIILDVTTEAKRGGFHTVVEGTKTVQKLNTPKLLAADDFERMRREAKGAAENHFRYQLLACSHKTEAALMDEIFGYSTTIREATEQGADAETVNALRRNLKKHESRDRKKLLSWFEREQAAGFLTFKRYTNQKGETVYKWKITTPHEPEKIQEQEPAPMEQ